jgi:hypothetical protein
VPYELRTELVGIVRCHADDCHARDGAPCRCGPLGYRGGVWDWQAARWVFSPLLNTTEEARAWQRHANRLGEDADGFASEHAEYEANPSEQLVWWSFCYVGLGFAGVALALFMSDIAG